ncbi:MAG TPA: hypothetical protein VF159_02060 [Gemmatimonadaceae bacterium]
MTDDRKIDHDADQSDSAPSSPDASGEDRMRGRSFEGAEYANTERDQTRDRERVARGQDLDEAGEPTDEALDPQGDLSPRRRDVGR